MAYEKHIEYTKKIIDEKGRRLQILKQQAVRFGPLYVPAYIATEIEDLETELLNDQETLRRLEAGQPDPDDLVVVKPSAPQRKKPAGWQLMAGLILALALLVAVTVFIINSLVTPAPTAPAVSVTAVIFSSPTITPGPTLTPTPTVEPMSPHGVNIAVAEFSVVNRDGLLLQPEDGQLLFDDLVTSIQATQVAQSQALRKGDVRPIGPIQETDPITRETLLEELAHTMNAIIVLYGRIERQANGVYQVYPEFYVRKGEQGFSYGEEIVGPTEFGKPVQITPPFTALEASAASAELQTRITALQQVVLGLAHFGEKEDPAALAAFEDARQTLVGAGFESGLEVVQLLIGAAKLREYRRFSGLELEPGIAADPLKAEFARKEAERAFAEGLAIDPDYARLNLGMGGIALAQINELMPDSGPLPDTVESRFIEARNWYSKALPANEAQSPQGYVPVKAKFGVAQTYLIEYQYLQQKGQLDLAKRAYEQAEIGFKTAVSAYREHGRPPQLAELAGQAQTLLGKLALLEAMNLEQNDQPEAAQKFYGQIVAACDDAHEILEGNDLAKSRLALYYRLGCYDWQAVAYARQQPSQPKAAKAACATAAALRQESDILPLEQLLCAPLLEIQDDTK